MIFNKILLKKYYAYKFSSWVERKITYKDIIINYPNLVSIKGLEIKNNQGNFYENLLEVKEIFIDIKLSSLFFKDLVILNDLVMLEPTFYLEITEKKLNPKKITEIKDGIDTSYNDNIGVAKKINENIADKVWPPKKKDINFLISKSKIFKPTAIIKISSNNKPYKVSMSDMKFNNVGNKKGYQHYKDVLKIIFFDIINSIKESKLQKFLKKIYKIN